MPKISRCRLTMNQGTRLGNTTWKLNPTGFNEKGVWRKKKVAFCTPKDAMHLKHNILKT